MTQAPKKIMLSAMRPSSRLTLGNYLGALLNWVKLQKEYDCLFFVVDLHTIDERLPPADFRELAYRGIATYIAAGIDPEKSLLFVQSHLPEHVELAWILGCHAYMGELNRMTQFKDKSLKSGTNIPTSIFTYPILMAADILLYRTNLVPVGEDQKQHLELARDLALRINNLYGQDVFVVPEVFIPPIGARILSLQDPSAKMSKSDEDTGGTVFLDDSDDGIRKKIKRAVTDSGTEVVYDESKPGVRNLINIQAAITGKKPAQIVADYTGKMYGHLKADTAEIVVSAVAPIRERANEILADRTYLEALVKMGAERARERATPTLKKLKERIGLIPSVN